MWRRLLGCSLIAGALSGCWTDERVGGVLSDEQLAALREQFKPLAAPSPCSAELGPEECTALQQLGQRLFSDPALSRTGTVSCASCHDPEAWMIDPRRENAVSMGVQDWTARNAISLVNVGFKQEGTFTWSGVRTPADVITTIAWPKAMGVAPVDIASKILLTPVYTNMYVQAFGAIGATDVAAGATLALEAFMRRLISVEAPFDRFIAGERSAMSEAAVRGFGVFAGRGMCIECHRGFLFSDGDFHVTGVPQAGLHAPVTDSGHAETGAFFTATLRNVANTAPYMHDGSLASLAEVVDFYRWGGRATDYPKDRFIEPLDIDDADAADLVAFLDALTGPSIDIALRTPLP